MPKLRGAFKLVREIVEAASPTCPITHVSLDDCTVTLSLKLSDANCCSVSLVYTDGDSYPNCGILVLSEQVEDLSHLADAFGDKAPLVEVIRKVCRHFQVNSSFLDPLTSPGQKTSAGSAEAVDMDMEGPENGQEYDGNGGSDVDGDDEGYVYSEAATDDEDAEEEDDDADQEMHDDDDDERDILTYCEKKRSKWRQHEQAIEEAEAEAAKNLSATQSQAAKLQIFNPQEAFTMLCKEMIDLMKANARNIQLIPDTVGDDIYHWNIELANFEPNSPLAQDLCKVQKLHGYSTVILRFHFTRGLHPFYPPSVEIVRPHFLSPILGAVAAHPMLQLPNWDPWRPQKELIDQIKVFLEKTARVDVSHPRNSIQEYEYAYSPVEQQLARIEALSGLPIMAHDKHRSVYDAMASYKREVAHLEALLQRKKRGRTDSEPAPSSNPELMEALAAAGQAAAAAAAGKPALNASPQRYWAAGTGYGHVGTDSGPVWDSKGAEAAQKAQDDEKQTVLRSLCRSLAAALKVVHTESSTENDASEGAAVEASTSEGTSPSQVDECVVQVEESCLIPFIITELGLPSFTDMITRARYYTTLFKLVCVLCQPASSRLLNMKYKDKSIADVACTCVDSAKKFLSVLQQFQAAHESAEAEDTAGPNNKKPKTATSDSDEEDDESSSPSTAPPPPAAPPTGGLYHHHHHHHHQASSNKLTPDEVQGAKLAEVIVDVERRLSQQGCSTSGANLNLTPYLARLKPLQLEYMEEFSSGHEYSRKGTTESVQPKDRVVRLAKEIAGLNSLLPLTESSSIHVRILESNIAMWKVLIIGPEDTPYSGACFMFDMYFPPTYPTLAPMVLLKTTGGGTIRFNPNLYNCGKVCLSLLGTWTGGRGETWNPDHSTALQILISIQSLILVPDPYFNEPGFEKNINTDQGMKMSRDYNKVIREAAVHRAMIDQLKKPPPEFKEVVETHFLMRGDFILRTITQWVEEGRTYDPLHADRLAKLQLELEGLIGSLKAKATAEQTGQAAAN